MNVTVIGLGYVGLVLSAGLASLGHKVVGYDLNQSKINALKQGIPTIEERGLIELLNDKTLNLYFSAAPKECFKDVDVIFITVDTPESENGACDVTHVSQALMTIVQYCQKEATIVIKSTVPTGTNAKVKEILNKQARGRFHLASNPEFLSQGRALKDMLNPMRIVIGTNDEVAQSDLALLYEPFSRKGVEILYTSPESAEVIKYASNSFLALKISFINELALYCDKIGADVNIVAKGMGLDPRIGSSFLNAGIGFGGTCFPKDTKALTISAHKVGTPLSIVETLIQVNEKVTLDFVNKIMERLKDFEKPTVAILGLSFKGETSDTRNSKAYPVVKMLLDANYSIMAYDKNSQSEFASKFGKHKNLRYCATIKEALKTVDAAVILNDAEEFKKLTQRNYIEMMSKKPIIFDGRNLYNLSDMTDVEYHSVGRPSIHKYDCKKR